ncbi:hypothetical protein ITP53_39595 [Nonomuraea sp. K274]|uniref:Tyr recombinase domain-containing protein n=1 Tax=Nonomuraea cypriaca TaxID=1187855 RepID=A0A931AGS5_9ACTN|nr:hypothetical protein [Nonomuraea cypriaca]MBF8191698.1 hypothetical protein [Nonomuraea cypriaca]
MTRRVKPSFACTWVPVSFLARWLSCPDMAAVRPRVAMQFLRHSRIAVTMDIYSEIPTDATAQAPGEQPPRVRLLHI